jgi:guanylate kinase
MLLPPSFAVQEARLRGRGTETEEKIGERLARAKAEVPQVTKYDYVVFNHDGQMREAAEDIRAIVRAEQRALRRNGDVATRYFD